MNSLMKSAVAGACALAGIAAGARTVVEVAADRTLTAEEEIAADTVFDVKEGVTLDMASRALTIAGVTGKGAVSNAKLTLTLAEGPYRFDGTMAGTLTFSKTSAVSLDEFHFIVGGAETLKEVSYTSPNVAATPIWFAPGVWQFTIKYITPSAKERFTTENTNGDPVAVNVLGLPEGFNASWRVIGSGDFYTNTRFGGGGIHYEVFSEQTGRMGPKSNNHQNYYNLNSLSHLEGVAICGGQFNYNLVGTTYPFTTYITGGKFYLAGSMSGEIVVPANKIRSSYSGWTLTYVGKVRFKDGCFFQWTDGRTICPDGTGELIFDNASPGCNKWPYANRYDGAVNCSLIRLVALTNGAWYGINSYLPTNFSITAGSHYYGDSGTTTATAAKPGVFYVNDANLDCLAASTGRTPLPSTHELHVGPLGARLHGFSYSCLSGQRAAYLDGLVRTDPGCAKDGGVAVSGSSTWYFKQPLAISGPFTLKSGVVTIPSGYTGTAESLPFGSGDFVFGSGILSDGSSQTTIPLASGSGAKLRVDGAAELLVSLGDTWTVGPSDATASSLARTAGPGGVLIVSAAGGDNTTVPVIVRGGVETTAAGLPKVPVVLRTSSATNVGVGNPYFAEYVSDAGFRAFSGGYVEYVDDCTATSVFRPCTNNTLADDLTVAAIDMKGQTIAIGEGKKLTVGDGTNPAVILLNKGSSTAKINGKGTLDFGTSEGVFVTPDPSGRCDHATVAATIAGSAGVSYHGIWTGGGNGHWEAVNISGSNTYAGVTRLCGIAAYVTHPKAFSDGTVTVDGGDLRGSRIIFYKTGLVLSNDVVASGYGGPHYNGWDSVKMGALNFAYAGELAGNLTCADRMFVGTFEIPGSGYYEGLLSGVVSGEGLVVLGGSGAIVMSNVNTVKHTEVYGRLILRGDNAEPCSGDLIMAGGTLRIENTAPRTLQSRIVGTGTIQLAGTGAVTFADAHQFQGKIDICGGDRAVNGLGDYVSNITNSVANTTGTLTVGDMRLGNTVVWTGLAAASGAVVNLQSRSQTLATLGGAGRLIGTPPTVTGEIHPGGEGAVGTLALGGGVTLGADAKLVTEFNADGIDKLSVGVDFSLDDLTLEVRRLTRSPTQTGTIFETSQTLSGAWKSVTLPSRGMYRLSDVEDESHVDLTVIKPGAAVYLK